MKTTKAMFCSQFGMYTALAFIFSYLEALIPMPALFPGMKLGLANVVLVFILYKKGFTFCLSVSVVRNVLTAATFGNPFMFFYSLVGSLLSVCSMAALKHFSKLSVVSISMAGGILHNAGQFLVALLVVGGTALWGYLPWLYVAGAITGVLMGVVSYHCLLRTKSLTIGVK